MNRFWKWTAGIFIMLLVAAFGVLSYMAGSPRTPMDGPVCLPHMHRGTLKVGSDAPMHELSPGRRKPFPHS